MVHKENEYSENHTPPGKLDLSRHAPPELCVYSLPLGDGQLQVLRRLQIKHNATHVTNRKAAKLNHRCGAVINSTLSHQCMMILKKPCLQTIEMKQQRGLQNHTLTQTLCIPIQTHRTRTHTGMSKHHGLYISAI